METLRCPTCVALLPDPEARRCPLCNSKLRKKRGRGAIVLGESNRLSGRSLPAEVELHVRAEERILPDEKRFEEIVQDPANLPGAPVSTPVADAPEFAAPEPLVSEAFAPTDTSETVEAVLAFAPTRAPVAAPVAGIDLTADPEPVIDVRKDDAEVPVAQPSADVGAGVIPEAVSGSSGSSGSKPAWKAVPSRTASPLDGNLNDMVGELHRKAREDDGNHGSR
jgi:hypothetical protein